MAFSAYACSTSVAQGDSLAFRVTDETGATGTASVSVINALTHATVHTGSAPHGVWSLPIALGWASSLYKAVFNPGGAEAYFVVRSRSPGVSSRIVVSIPFATWQAYNRAGTPGESIYWNEQPDRASRVSFDRPTGGPSSWENGFLNWFPTSGYAIEYCSGLDLHDGLAFLSAYQMLVCIGHDEYWSREMRETAEIFAERGGNIAFFTGNTCWWQVRFEDNMRTMVCYREAVHDPLTNVDDSRVTVEWTSAPVNDPENSLTGVSFRRGAGCWGNVGIMSATSYTCRFDAHWVFAGTGLHNGDAFATGAVGYETDAAEYEEISGIPCITGRDGTPSSFVILATADLASWRRWGQGGMATMGIFRKGGGTVFNAATTGWGARLGDPTVARITRNVFDRLSHRYPTDEWEVIGHANDVTAMVACENALWASDSHNRLWRREPVGQNLNWLRVGHANNVIAMASPRESTGGQSIGLYAVTRDGGLWYRDPIPSNINWTRIADAHGIIALAACYEWLFAATDTNALLYMPLSALAGPSPAWLSAGHANNVVAMTNLNGRLYAADRNNRLWMRLPLRVNTNWTDIGHADFLTGLAGYAGRLYASTTHQVLWWRDAVAL